MRWRLSHRADPPAVSLADRHYNRQHVGSPQFVPPGACLVFVVDGDGPEPDAVWTTSWPKAEYVKHRWAGAWVNSIFRNERPDRHLSSELIRDALAATCWHWITPEIGMITFVDATKVRHKRDPGRCYRRAGFRPVGETVGGLIALQLLPADMPEPAPPIRAQFVLGV